MKQKVNKDWPIYEVNEDNELCVLEWLVEMFPRNYFKFTTGWDWVAEELNRTFQNDRTGEDCRIKYEELCRVEWAKYGEADESYEQAVARRISEAQGKAL